MDAWDAIDGVADAGVDASSRRVFPYRRHFAVVGIFAVAATVGACLIYTVEYLGGWFSCPGLGFLVALPFFPALGLATLAFFARGFFLFFKRPRNGREMVLRLPLLVIPPLVLVMTILIDTPMAPIFLRGFKWWALRHVDVRAVQEWLAVEGPAFAEKHVDQYHRYDFPAEYPKCLVEFRPKFITFDHTPEGELTVEFGWGGGLADWGVVVGPPTMKTPETGEVQLNRSEVEFRRPVKPGAYVVDRSG